MQSCCTGNGGRLPSFCLLASKSKCDAMSVVQDHLTGVLRPGLPERGYEDGELLLRQGEQGTFMMYILEGQVEVTVRLQIPRDGSTIRYSITHAHDINATAGQDRAHSFAWQQKFLILRFGPCKQYGALVAPCLVESRACKGQRPCVSRRCKCVTSVPFNTCE